MKTERAQPCADFAARHVEMDMVGVYDDGVIMYASLAEETAKSMAHALACYCREHGTELEAALSSDGLWWAFILPGAEEEELRPFLSLHLALHDKDNDFGILDCRMKDHHMIELFVDLLRQEEEANGSSSR